MLLQETYEILDTLFNDSATANWVTQGGTNTYNDGVRTFTTTSNNYIVPHIPNGTGYNLDYPFNSILEFDIITDSMERIELQSSDGTNNNNLRIESYLSDNCHVLVKFYRDKFNGYVNGSTTPSFSKTYDSSLTGDKLRISIRGYNGTLTFSNLRIYPI